MSRNSGRTNRKAVGTLAGLGSAAAIVGAGIAAMATGSVPTAAPQPDHSGVQTATLTADRTAGPATTGGAATTGGTTTTGGTGTVDNAGFPPPPPVTSTPSLNGSQQTNTAPAFPGLTQNTALSTNNPGGGAFAFLPTTDQTGIAATPNGLSLNVNTSNTNLLGFGNAGFSPGLKVSTNGDSTTVTPGGFFGLNIPGLGGGTAPVGLGINIDNNGNVSDPSLTKFFGAFGDLGKLNANTTGFAADQPTNPNFNTDIFGGGPITGDPFSTQTAAAALNFVNADQAAQAAALVNGITLPSQQLGLDPATAGNFSMFAPANPASAAAVNNFFTAPNPATPSAVGLAQGDGTNIGAMFNDSAPSSFAAQAQDTPPPGIPTFQQAMQSASPGLPASSVTDGPTTSGIIASTADPATITAAVNNAAMMQTDPTQLPTVYAIAQSYGFSPS